MDEQQVFIGETTLKVNIPFTVIPFCHQCKKPLMITFKHYTDLTTVSIHIVPCENCTVNYAPPTDRKELW